MFRGKFEIRKDVNGKEYFVLKARNGKIVATSESYNSRQALLSGIKAVRATALFATVEERQ